MTKFLKYVIFNDTVFDVVDFVNFTASKKEDYDFQSCYFYSFYFSYYYFGFCFRPGGDRTSRKSIAFQCEATQRNSKVYIKQ